MLVKCDLLRQGKRQTNKQTYETTDILTKIFDFANNNELKASECVNKTEQKLTPFQQVALKNGQGCCNRNSVKLITDVLKSDLCGEMEDNSWGFPGICMKRESK